jgi:hypothetical protein
MVREQLQQVDNWRQQNKADQRADMQQLEGLMLQAVGGVEGLTRQLATQEGMLEGQAVKLEQVQRWLAEMHASSTVISDHLKHLSIEVAEIKNEVHVIRRVQDDIATKVEWMYKRMRSIEHLTAELTNLGPSELMIPRSSIVIPNDAFSKGSAGNYGTVVRATRDGGVVAVKKYNISTAGEIDQKAALKEALLLSQVRHHNVVKCWGLVHDPYGTHGHSLHGSLVMEWVRGGNLYKWLQANPNAGLKLRVQLAQQVAAGMRHLHQQDLVHGDVKPENVLLQFNQGEELPEVILTLACILATSALLCLTF